MRLYELINKVLNDISNTVGWQRDVQHGLLQSIVNDNNNTFTQFAVNAESKDNVISFTIRDSGEVYTGIFSAILNDAAIDTNDSSDVVQKVVALMNKEV